MGDSQLNLMKPKYLEGKSERRYTEVTTERENKSRRTLRNYVEGENCLKSTTLGSDSLTEPLVPVTQTEYRPVSNFDGPNHVQDPQEPPKAEIAGRESKNSCTAEDTSKESSKPKTPLAQTPIAHRPKRTIKKLCGRRNNCTYLVQVANKIRFIHADCLKSTTLGSDSLTEPLVPVTQTEYRPVSNFDGPNHVQDPQEPPKAEIAGRESKNSCTAEDTSKESSKPKTPLAQTPIAHRPKRTINPPKRLDL
ncbi:hypothetical protein QE152_g29928 [Popillia japonica]|uniref:Uncharacterized protein n=1 Tax=Popillia japonica TaxID=7064 RepID=A0AAW1JG18_POPJA